MKRISAAARLALLAVFLSIPVLSGCATVDAKDTSAERHAFEIWAPAWTKYFEADSTLTEVQKNDRRDLIKAVDSRIKNKEREISK
jgi:hypothetical protein